MKNIDPSAAPPICGIVLAAGEGIRLRPMIDRLRGDRLPKQYVNFVGRRSMLDHTFARAERIIPRARIFTVVGRGHLAYGDVRRQLSARSPGTVVVQPANLDTGPGILLPLIHLRRRYPDAVVALFPSDHFVLDEKRLMGRVSAAARAVLQEPTRLILLAIEPERPEPQYGYVLPDRADDRPSPAGIRRVSCFIEKPHESAARRIIARGGLWNTMIMVFKADALLEVYRKFAPALVQAFRPVAEAIGGPAEGPVVERAYRRVAPMNFSGDMLESVVRKEPGRLSVLPVGGVRWSDWGSEERIVEMIRSVNRRFGAGSDAARLRGRKAPELRWRPGLHLENFR